MSLLLQQQKSSQKSISSSSHEANLNHSQKDNCKNKKPKNLIDRTSFQQSLSKYHEIMSQIQGNHRSLSHLIEQLRNHGIQYNEKYTPTQSLKIKNLHFQIVKIQPTKYLQAVTFYITLGPFQQILYAYNTFELSSFSQINSINLRNLSRIYQVKSGCKSFIAKSYALNVSQVKQTQSFKILENTLKEVFITKMMSALKIGPQFCNQFGFDLFVSFKEVFFFLQVCEQLGPEKFTKADARTLKRGLKQMHMLQILHADIKPDNIMYSPSYQKYVLIDFGISEYRTQKCGELIYTNFSGTYAFSTNEMKQLFETSQSDWVSLHYNDAFGLVMSIQEIRKVNRWFFVDNNEFDSVNLKEISCEQMEELMIKHTLVKMRDEEIEGLKVRQNLKMIRSIMKFFYEIPVTESIRKLYKEFMQDFLVQPEEFKDLKSIFADKIFIKSYQGKRTPQTSMQMRQILIYQQLYNQVNKRCSEVNKSLINQIHYFISDDVNAYLSSLRPTNQASLMFQLLKPSKADNTLSTKKIQFCKCVIKVKNIPLQKDLSQIPHTQAILIMFNHIITSVTVQQKALNFQFYIMLIQNYMILSETFKSQILEDILSVQIEIDKRLDLSYLDKIQFILTIALFLQQILSQYDEDDLYFRVEDVKQELRQKVLCYALKVQDEKSRQITEIYCSCLEYFFTHKYLSINKENPYLILQKLNRIQKRKFGQRRRDQLLLHIQSRLLAFVQWIDLSGIRKDQMQEKLVAQFESTISIYSLLDLIMFYQRWEDYGQIRKYLTIYDSTLQIQRLNQARFHTIRLVLALVEYQQSPIKQPQIADSLLKRIQSYLHVTQNFRPKFIQQIGFIYNSLIKNSQDQANSIFAEQVLKILKQKIYQAIQVLQSQTIPIVYQGSTNLLYLQLLQKIINIQLMQINDSIKPPEITTNSQGIEFLFQRDLRYVKTQSFHKIVNVNRQGFVSIDHIMLILYDIIWIGYSNQKYAARQAYAYLLDKKQIISQFFYLQNQRLYNSIFRSFSFFTTLLDKQNDFDLFKKGIQLVYSLVNTKYMLSLITLHFNFSIYPSLLKIQMFDVIFDDLKNLCTLVMPKDLSVQALDFAKSFIIHFLHDIKLLKLQAPFYEHLDSFVKTFDCDKIPSIGIFLIFCITPLNRQFLIMKIMKCLKNIAYNGKVLILQRFYKQLLHLKNFGSANKRKFLLKKYLLFSSDQKRKLEDIKVLLNCKAKMVRFKGIFKQKLDKKVIKLGKCCQISQ